jgi:hypothetical protein
VAAHPQWPTSGPPAMPTTWRMRAGPSGLAGWPSSAGHRDPPRLRPVLERCRSRSSTSPPAVRRGAPLRGSRPGFDTPGCAAP